MLAAEALPPDARFKKQLAVFVLVRAIGAGTVRAAGRAQVGDAKRLFALGRPVERLAMLHVHVLALVRAAERAAKRVVTAWHAHEIVDLRVFERVHVCPSSKQPEKFLDCDL